MGRQK